MGAALETEESHAGCRIFQGISWGEERWGMFPMISVKPQFGAVCKSSPQETHQKRTQPG